MNKRIVLNVEYVELAKLEVLKVKYKCRSPEDTIKHLINEAYDLFKRR